MDERGGLENRYAFRRIVGSNPTPSAISDRKRSINIQRSLRGPWRVPLEIAREGT